LIKCRAKIYAYFVKHWNTKGNNFGIWNLEFEI